MDMTRNQFLRLLAGTGAGALGLGALGACDGSDSKPVDAAAGDAKPVDAAIDAKPVDAFVGNCLQNGTNTVISFNHGHQMTVPLADVMAGVDKTYQIQGTSLHPHMVVITAAQFAMLQANTNIMVTSSVDVGHSHPVTVSCA